MKVDHTRYYPNPKLSSSFADSGRDNGEEDPETEVALRSPSAQATPRSLLGLETIQTLIRECHDAHTLTPPSSLGSLYTGALGSVVYLDFQLSKLLRRRINENNDGDETASHSLLQSALKQAQQAAKHHESRSSRRVTLLESPFVGAKALEAAILHTLGQSKAARQSATQLLRWIQHKTSHINMAPNECEVLYGRAGALQAILFLRQEFQDETLGSDLALQLARAILREGKGVAKQNSRDIRLALLWYWHDSFYLGAAHGVVGILHTLLMLNPHERQQLNQEHNMLSLILQTIQGLNNRYCHPSGNLDSSIKYKMGTDRLVQWCHGAVGHILLLKQAATIYPNHAEAFQSLACRLANDVVWPRGLLQKGVGLCHGISGNAYSILALAQDNQSLHEKAVVFADFALQNLDQLESVPDRPYSLYEGLGGLCLLLMDLLLLQEGMEEPNSVCFPLYTFRAHR